MCVDASAIRCVWMAMLPFPLSTQFSTYTELRQDLFFYLQPCFPYNLNLHVASLHYIVTKFTISLSTHTSIDHLGLKPIDEVKCMVWVVPCMMCPIAANVSCNRPDAWHVLSYRYIWTSSYDGTWPTVVFVFRICVITRYFPKCPIWHLVANRFYYNRKTHLEHSS